MSFIPSKYQQAVYDFITNNTGNAVVSAVAGSGKTTTIVNAMALIDVRHSVLFLAFNRDIMKELKKKVIKLGRPNIDVSTVHSFGFTTIRSKVKDAEIDGRKYNKILKELEEDYIKDMTPDQLENVKVWRDNVKQLIQLSRLNYDVSRDGMNNIVDKYRMELVNGEIGAALDVVKIGRDVIDVVDFTDMIYLPLYHGLPIPTYSYTFIDECQDLSACQRMIMEKTTFNGGRFIAVGDPYQAIYGFAGADAESFKKLTEIENTVQLPLSVCYRCGSDIVEKAKTIVPHIESFEKSDRGEVSYEVDVHRDLIDGDMVLCRNTFPLVRLTLQLIANGRKAIIKGRDIGQNIISMIQEAEADDIDGLMKELYQDLDYLAERIAKKENISKEKAMERQAYQIQEEKVQVIRLISHKVDNVDGIIDELESIFSDNNVDDGIQLSTVHKSKGLEADRVVIIHSNLMPSKNAQTEWEREQEYNIMYVAYTRAKTFLGFDTEYDAYNKRDNDNFKSYDKKDIPNPVPVTGGYVGDIGEIVEINVTIRDKKPITTRIGTTDKYILVDDGGNILTKIGAFMRDTGIGDRVMIKAPVKSHSEFMGVKETLLGQIISISKL